MELMLEEVKWCKKMIKKNFNKAMIPTKKDKHDFKTANKCQICDKKYCQKDVRVRDHCHITAKYRESAHQNCNLKLQMKVYDSHFIISSYKAF